MLYIKAISDRFEVFSKDWLNFVTVKLNHFLECVPFLIIIFSVGTHTYFTMKHTLVTHKIIAEKHLCKLICSNSTYYTRFSTSELLISPRRLALSTLPTPLCFTWFSFWPERSTLQNRCQSCSPFKKKKLHFGQNEKIFSSRQIRDKLFPREWVARNCFSSSKRCRVFLPSFLRGFPLFIRSTHTHTRTQHDKRPLRGLMKFSDPWMRAEPKSKMGQFFVVYGFDNYVSVQDWGKFMATVWKVFRRFFFWIVLSVLEKKNDDF